MSNDIPDNVDLNWIAQNLLALRADLSALRADMAALRADTSALRAEIQREFTAFRTEVRQAFNAVRADIAIINTAILFQDTEVRNLRDRVGRLEERR